MSAELKDGPELDALVAEKVMGWTRPKMPIPDGWGLKDRSGPWEFRIYDEAWPLGGGDWRYTVAETLSLEQFAERFYWRGPDGEYHKAEHCLSSPEVEYSADLAAAWLVVSEMERRGFWLKLTSPWEPADGRESCRMWNAGFTPHGFTGRNGSPDHKGQGGIAPLAICLAALRVVEKAESGPTLDAPT